MKDSRDGPRAIWWLRHLFAVTLALVTVALVCQQALAIEIREAPTSLLSHREHEIRVHLRSSRALEYSISGTSLRFPGSIGLSMAGYRALKIQMLRKNRRLADWKISDRDSGEVLAHIQSHSFSVSGENLRLNLQPIPGRLTLWPSEISPDVLVLAAVDLETYVRGVLPSEMPSGWPLEALKAQAVAIRSFALFRQQERERVHAPYDVESSIADQVFTVPVMNGVDQNLAQVERAVRETRGLLLVTRSESPAVLPSYYHADCGGKTEDAHTLWGQKGAGTAVDTGCPLNPQAHWKAELSSRDIAFAVKERLTTRPEVASHAESLELVDLQAIGKTSSGRVAQIRLKWSGGEYDDVASHDFRMALGSEVLRSTNFKLKRSKVAGYLFTGVGYGHGVGMCQWGARSLAQGGRLYREILKHYYPDSALIQAGESQVAQVAGSD